MIKFFTDGRLFVGCFFIRKINFLLIKLENSKIHNEKIRRKDVHIMLNLREAIKKAEVKSGKKVIGALDCGDRWILTFAEDKEKIPAEPAPVFVFKETGRHEYFFIGDYKKFINEGKPVDLNALD